MKFVYVCQPNIKIQKMKRIIVIATAVFLMFSINAFAQTGKVKLGHVNSEELLKIMPGRDSAETKYKSYAKSIETQFQTMQAELESKYQDYQANSSTMSALIKQMKEKEITDLQKRIQDFQMSAQEDMEGKEKELLQPMIDKAKKAVEDVAKENGYTYVFDTSLGVLLYSDPGDNILPLVKKKLGIQ